MRFRFSDKRSLAAAVALAALAVVPAEATASHKPLPFEATATIAACRGESLTIAAQIEPAADAGRRALRAIRRAELRLRFEAAPLYGGVRRSREVDLGRTINARRAVRFTDLPAQSYNGIVRYRWVRGKRTVRSGFVRTRRMRVAGRRGRAFCSLRVGKRPVDTTPPFIAPIPGDSGWRRGPLTVRFFVFDDLSGVALVVSRVDGGPFVRGRTTTIRGEGSHRLEYIARDAAGNQTPVGAVTLRVDEHPPTPPVVTAPPSSTPDGTPEITWTASTDTGSGVVGYIVLVRDAGGTIVWATNVPASAARAVSVGEVLPPGDYTAEVIAYDGAGRPPFTATGTRAFTVVPPPPQDTDGDEVPDTTDNCPTTFNDSQTDTDSDGQGDACDSDDDNDGSPDSEEASEGTNPLIADTDGDGVEDGPDQCPLDNPPSDTNGDGCFP